MDKANLEEVSTRCSGAQWGSGTAGLGVGESLMTHCERHSK